MLLARTELWDPSVSFYENEMEFAFDAFVCGRYRVVETYTEGNVWYRIWECENERIAMAVNRSYNTTESCTFPMSGYTHGAVFGGTESGRIYVENETVRFRLAPGGAVLARLKPKAGSKPALFGEKWEHLQSIAPGQTVYGAVTPIKRARLLTCLYKTVEGKKMLVAFDTAEGEDELVTAFTVPDEVAPYFAKTMVWDALVPMKGETDEN